VTFVFYALCSRLADLTAKDLDKNLLEKAKNELESYVYEAQDRLSRDIYEKCSTEENRETLRTLLSEASDWLYEQEEETPKQVQGCRLAFSSIMI